MCRTQPPADSVSVVFLCLLLLANAQDWAVDDQGCRVPGGGVGNCIVINQCQPILDFLISVPKPISDQDSEKLRKYQCGYTTDSVKVCCPSDPIISDKVGGAEPDPPDVSNHRNLHLINSDICGPMNQLNRILNGNKTSLFDFPWMALLSYQIKRSRDFLCGATLINSKYVLTAAHCLTNLKGKVLLGVRIGEHNIDTAEDCQDFDGTYICADPVQDFAIEEVIPHPEYDTRYHNNDIGLIRLAGEANLDPDTVKPICLPVTPNVQNFNFTGQNVTVTGWGVTETGKKSAELLQVSLPIFEAKSCKQVYKKSSLDIKHNQICAGGRNMTDSCGGDSGGPMQITELFQPGDSRYFQVGIVSFGPKNCGAEGLPGVYAKVAYYMDWILDNLKP